MKKLSARDYDVFKPEFDFQKEPSGSDFFISPNGDGFSWSTNGKTLADSISSITRATHSIKTYANEKNLTGKVWFISGNERKLIGNI